MDSFKAGDLVTFRLHGESYGLARIVYVEDLSLHSLYHLEILDAVLTAQDEGVDSYGVPYGRSHVLDGAESSPVVIDHMGRAMGRDGPDQPAVQALVELAKRDNCWIKVTGAERISFPPYDEAIPIAKRLMAAAPDRVLWGTDFPHPNATHEADEAELVDLVPKFAPDAAAQKKLLVDNPARLYGF